jgi:tetratricopeptide (TPR) repeat protein
MSRRLSIAFALLVFSGSGSAARAAADPSEKNEMEGRRQYKVGEQLMAAGRYAEAAKAFEAGFEAAPRAGFLLNIANCHRRLGDLGKARKFYWSFLDAAAKSHPSRPEVIEFLKSIEEINADGVPLDVPGTADLGAAREAGALSQVAPVPAPPPEAEAPRPYATLLAAPDSAPAQQQPIDEVRPSVFKRWWFWTLVGGAVAAGTGTLLWARSQTAPSGCEASLGCIHE